MLISLPKKIASTLLYEGQPARNISVELSLHREITKLLDVRQEFSPEFRSQLIAFPAACAPFGAELMASEAESEWFLAEPFCALLATYHNPALARELEHVIFQNGEAMLEYETWRNSNDRPLHNEQARQDCAYREPFWGWRLSRSTGNTALEFAILEYVDNKKGTEAGSALMHLILHEEDSCAAFAPIIHKSQQHTYLANKFLALRNFPVGPSPLVELTPRWACHYALLNPPAANAMPDQAIVSALLACPGWTVEFLVRAGKTSQSQLLLDVVQRSLQECIRLGKAGHNGIGAMKLYSDMAVSWAAAFSTYRTMGAVGEHFSNGLLVPRPQ